MQRRWGIASLLFFSTLLNYFDRQIFSLVSPVIRLQFAMSAKQYSHLLTAFLAGYTVTQLFAGIIVDKLGARRGLMLAMLWWSIAGASVALARTPLQLGFFLMLMGVGEAANWPASVKTVREWFEPEKRAVAVGFFNSGSSVGAILAPFIVASLTLKYSWRAAFLVCGVVGMLWILVWRLVYEAPPLLSDSSFQGATPTFAFLKNRRAWGILLGRFFCDPVWIFYVFWLPDYLSHSQGLSLKEIGQTAWIPFVAAALGNFAGGAASSWLVRRHMEAVRSRITVMGVSALVMTSGFAVRYCHRPVWALLVISIVVFAYSAWAANILTLPGDTFPSGTVASVTGTSGTAAGLGGMLTTLLTGYLVDHYSYVPVFWVLACLPLAAFSCALLTLPSRSEPSEYVHVRVRAA
jgi:ACS family hexuronate transporter-like MFS transporter